MDYIEAGFPVASQGDFEAVRAIARTVQGPAIAGLSRTQVADVDRCWDALRDAERARIHVFISTSPQHMEHMLKMDQAQVLAATRSGVARAAEHTRDVEFSPQDATRTPLDFMLEVLQAAVDNGATTLNIPDTVGYGIPWDFGALIQYIRREVKGDYVTSVHCHNDLGLATANSLAGVQAGARQIEVCVNGLGERAGNAALEEVVMAVKIRADQFPGLTTGVHTEELARTSRLVSRLTGYPIQYNKAVVGRNAFAHESGIHQHGVLADRSTYEIIDASEVGQVGSQIVLGKHSGRHAFSDTLAKMGIHVSGDMLNAAFTRFKELADRKVELTDADLEAIVAEEMGERLEDTFSLESLEVSGGTVGVPRATVVVPARRREDGGHRRGRRHDRRRLQGHQGRHRRRRHPHRLQRLRRHRRRRRPRRRHRPARGRRHPGVRPRRVDRRRRGLGPRLPERGQQGPAHPGPVRGAPGRGRAVTSSPSGCTTPRIRGQLQPEQPGEGPLRWAGCRMTPQR